MRFFMVWDLVKFENIKAVTPYDGLSIKEKRTSHRVLHKIFELRKKFSKQFIFVLLLIRKRFFEMEQEFVNILYYSLSKNHT